jgi:molybdopterin/thiamine biosynthesis adenylyltransferase/rhodanese-related sulfurtransferase
MTHSDTDPAVSTPELSPEELRRYARHFAIPEFGVEAQRKLKAARVLVIGAGGLGSPVTLYLAAAGVGHITLADPDSVELSNLQRQILFSESDQGRKKLDAARDRLLGVNPHLSLSLRGETFSAANAMEMARGHDVIIDGTDNFPTRYLSNDVAVWLKIPNVYGSILRFEGQVSVFDTARGGPCYRCMAPNPPAPGLVPSCAEGGVLGVLPGIIGSLQALEAVKLIAGIGEPLVARLLHLDALAMRFRTLRLRRDPDCPVCGDQPAITEPVDYHGFCGLPSSPPEKRDSLESITATELKAMMDRCEDFLLLDVREPWEHELAGIPGAQNLPLGTLKTEPPALDLRRMIVAHCKSGIRSAAACEILVNLGAARVLNLAGGIHAWSDEIDPSVPKY